MLQPPLESDDLTQDLDVLPAYSRGERSAALNNAQPVQHVYSLLNKHQRPWLSLKLHSRSRQPTSIPIYFKADTITGTVDLNLGNSESIQSIILKFRADMAAPHGIHEFWSDSLTLWAPGTTDSAADGTQLKGSHSFPIHYKLPTKCHSKGDATDLPPSHPGATKIIYSLGVIVQRGRFKPNNKLWNEFIYWPRTRASQPSPIRQIAYLEHTPLSGPRSDAEGWHKMEPITLSGQLFSARYLDVKFELAIAKPLQFARNNAIPLWLTIESTDKQALDLLAKPSCLVIGLVQEDTWYSGSSLNTKGIDIPIYNIDTVGSMRLKAGRYLQCLKNANWWVPNNDGTAEDTKRELEGEIHISRDLTASFEFVNGKVCYYVCLFPPMCAGFSLRSKVKGARCRQAVQIVTDVAIGPKPRSYSPPGYEDEDTTELTKMSRDLSIEWEW